MHKSRLVFPACKLEVQQLPVSQLTMLPGQKIDRQIFFAYDQSHFIDALDHIPEKVKLCHFEVPLPVSHITPLYSDYEIGS